MRVWYSNSYDRIALCPMVAKHILSSKAFHARLDCKPFGWIFVTLDNIRAAWKVVIR